MLESCIYDYSYGRVNRSDERMYRMHHMDDKRPPRWNPSYRRALEPVEVCTPDRSLVGFRCELRAWVACS